eukprot:CAMPEP_0117748460 /NCGR_PEP_ID=MMETSP0947-20121206/9148_1 /TAXON_ID=44440 /ORGANISM="Chattonella subsalsa, Strain CCMP2191" /LENGTH=96 /DNA_ID=CAMNT_0005566165 /DNA_START=1 /DNA_END=288 /DNA_ORIENTATION=+
MKTLNPSFYQRFDFQTTLPGISQLKIAVWDKDMILDELVGETHIDLEDRWYDARWQAIKFKPIETKNLWSESASVSQGVLTMWLDIYDRRKAKENP